MFHRQLFACWHTQLFSDQQQIILNWTMNHVRKRARPSRYSVSFFLFFCKWKTWPYLPPWGPSCLCAIVILTDSRNPRSHESQWHSLAPLPCPAQISLVHDPTPYHSPRQEKGLIFRWRTQYFSDSVWVTNREGRPGPSLPQMQWCARYCKIQILFA